MKDTSIKTLNPKNKSCVKYDIFLHFAVFTVVSDKGTLSQTLSRIPRIFDVRIFHKEVPRMVKIGPDINLSIFVG